MDVVDIILGVFILILAVRGLLRGFVREIFGLAALIAGIVAADVFGKSFGLSVVHHLTVSPAIAFGISFFFVFLVVYLLLIFIGYVLSSFLRKIELGWMDRSLGFAFGLAKATLFIGIIAFVFESFPFFSFINRDLKKSSYIYSSVEYAINRIDIAKLIQKARRKENKGITVIMLGGKNA